MVNLTHPTGIYPDLHSGEEPEGLHPIMIKGSLTFSMSSLQGTQIVGLRIPASQVRISKVEDTVYEAHKERIERTLEIDFQFVQPLISPF